MTNSESTINFMYFANNFYTEDINTLLKLTGIEQHLRDKWNSKAAKNGTEKFLWLFMQLSQSYKEMWLQWIEENYSYKS